MARKTAKVSDGNVETDDLLIQARKDYDRCREAWHENQEKAKFDLRFARLSEQWDAKLKADRIREGKPVETFNKLPTFIRQVVNDARQNKPAIKVHPQDSGADPRVADIYNGLIRNIETASDADVATDTAVEHAVGQGFGFWRYNLAYVCDDAFEQDIICERVSNPFTVYGDPRSTAADSSDWNVAFVITTMSRDEFEAEYPDAEKVDWEFDFKDCPEWLDGDDVVVAEWWTRRKVKKQIIALSDGSVEDVESVDARAEELTAAGIQVVGKPRETESYKVTQRLMSGAEVLKTVEWAGKFIPIVPVYGDEVIDEQGKRHFRSLIRDVIGAQRMYNYMRNMAITLLALQPRVPFIGPKGAFDGDENWQNANDETVAYLEYDGPERPTREAPPQGSQAVLQEALNANEDMKSIIGIYDASLGARSNETSGRAIMARQREGDVSTFHFIDNLSRAIRHGGRILLDLIPKVYTTERMVRILGEDLTPYSVKVAPTGQPVQQQQDGHGNVIGEIFDLTAGKYDLTVSAGPSFTTMREENRQMMTEMAQAGGPEVASVLIPRIAKLMELPDADTIGDELNAKLNPQQGGLPPQVQQQMQQGMQLIQQQAQQLQQAQQRIQSLEQDAQLKSRELDIKERELQIKGFEAQTDRIQAEQPTFVRSPPTQMGAA